MLNSYAYDRFSLELKDKTKLKLSSECMKENDASLTPGEKPCTITVEAFQKGIKITEYSYRSYIDNNLYFNSIIGHPLKNVEDIFTITVSSGYCGGGVYENYLVWTGKEIRSLISTVGVPDGNYSSGSEVLFSDDPNFSDIVTLVHYEGNEDQAGNGYKTYQVTLFQWNGRDLVEVSKDTGKQP